MSWPQDALARFKAWIAPATPTDEQATGALALALETVELWLDRPLELLERIEESWTVTGLVRLRAWPVTAIAGVVVGEPAVPIATPALVVDKRTGRLAVPAVCGHVVVTYTGGLDPFPPGLELALFMVAAELLPLVSSSAGAAELGEAVRRVTSPDAGTVEYASSAETAGRQADQLLAGEMPPQVESLLWRYRAEGPIGAA